LQPLPTSPQFISGGILGDGMFGGGILSRHPAILAHGLTGAAGGGAPQQYTDLAPTAFLQRGPINTLGLGPFGGPSFSHSLSFFDPANFPVPPPQASGTAPQPRLFPSQIRDKSLAGQGAGDLGVLSDADPDAWLPNAQYANRGARRGGRRAGEPELSPIEEIRLMMYNHNWEILRQLEPQNRLLFSIQNREWVPSQRDIQRLQEEIARARREQSAWTLERHHNLPNEFGNRFNACDLDPEDFITYMSRDLHRLAPYGWHTGPNNWNSVWRRFFGEQPTKEEEAKEAEEIYRQLLKMWGTVPWKKP
jgi:hypothetical protein